MRLPRIAAVLLALLLMLPGCSERSLDGEKPSSEPQSSQEALPESSEPEEVPPPAEEVKERAKGYADILSSGQYYIDCTAEIEVEGMTLSNPMLIAVEGENSSISVSSDLSGTMVTMRTLTLDGSVYMINDNARTYMEIPAGQSANSFDTDYSGMEYSGSGEGDFCGEQREYEEYHKDGEAIRFFFEGDRLVGLTRAIEDEQVAEMTLRVTAISPNIPDRLIAMPIGYQQQ